MPDMPLITGDPNNMPAPGGPPPQPPAPAGPGPTNPLADAPPASGPLQLTPDQMDALNIADLAPGDSQTICLKRSEAGEPGEGGSTGTSFEVVSSEPDKGVEPGPEEGEGGAPGPETEEAPEAEGETTPDAESQMIGGYARKKKKIREGLPDTKKMRDL